jgi:hypothetical protein
MTHLCKPRGEAEVQIQPTRSLGAWRGWVFFKSSILKVISITPVFRLQRPTKRAMNIRTVDSFAKMSILCFRCTTPFSSSATLRSQPGRPYYRGFTITLRRITLGSTPLDKWSARHRDLYLTTHSTHKRQTSMLPARFEPTIPASEWPQTHALDRTANGIGMQI